MVVVLLYFILPKIQLKTILDKQDDRGQISGSFERWVEFELD